MSRDKQIDEMAKIIDDNHGFIVSSVETAEALYNAGYRKASDLAEEIFAEIEKVAEVGRIMNACAIVSLDELDEIKKKYIGKDTNVTTNTEEGK